MTKPVRPTEIVIGRMLGFVGVGTMMLVPMGLASYVFVTRAAFGTPTPMSKELVEVASRVTSRATTDYVRCPQTHLHPRTATGRLSLQPSAGPQRLLPTESDRLCPRTSTHRQPCSRTERLRSNRPLVRSALVFPRTVTFSFTIAAATRRSLGIDVGAERLRWRLPSVPASSRVFGLTKGSRKIEHSYIEGGTLAMAEFTFSNVTPERYPDYIPLDLSIRAYRSWKGDIESGNSRLGDDETSQPAVGNRTDRVCC